MSLLSFVDPLLVVASVCHILESTNLHAALDVASEGARICESLQTSNGDDAYHLFSKNYSLQV